MQKSIIGIDISKKDFSVSLFQNNKHTVQCPLIAQGVLGWAGYIIHFFHGPLRSLVDGVPLQETSSLLNVIRG